MKVLVCVPELEKPGGVASYYRLMREHFAMDVRFFTRGSRGAGQGTLREVSRLGRDYLKFLMLLRQDRQIRIVHINTSFGWKGLFRDSVFVLLAKLEQRKVLVFFRGWDRRFERQITRPSVRLALRAFFSADRMLVLSDQFRDSLQRWGYAGKVSTESTAVDQKLIDAACIRRTECDTKDTITILFLARLEEEKGVYTALDTHVELLSRFPSIRLLIAGDGKERENLERFVEQKGIPNVEFLGYVRGEEKIAAFQRADIYLLPTTHGEGMPNSVLEAMAFGLPIVTRPVGGLADIVRDGEVGFLTDATSGKEFADLVTRLLEDRDLNARIASTNRQYAAHRFAAPKVAQRLETVYRELANGRG
jgi:glycosyltransferase involved in cell wall biosynthesis